VAALAERARASPAVQQAKIRRWAMRCPCALARARHPLLGATLAVEAVAAAVAVAAVAVECVAVPLALLLLELVLELQQLVLRIGQLLSTLKRRH